MIGLACITMASLKSSKTKFYLIFVSHIIKLFFLFGSVHGLFQQLINKACMSFNIYLNISYENVSSLKNISKIVRLQIFE